MTTRHIVQITLLSHVDSTTRRMTFSNLLNSSTRPIWVNRRCSSRKFPPVIRMIAAMLSSSAIPPSGNDGATAPRPLWNGRPPISSFGGCLGRCEYRRKDYGLPPYGNQYGFWRWRWLSSVAVSSKITNRRCGDPKLQLR